MFYYDVGKRQTGRKCVKFTDYAEREVICVLKGKIVLR